MPEPVQINDQPISATFFGEGRWLTDFVTPHALEVQELHKQITEGINDLHGRLFACWNWVAEQVKYVKFVQAKLIIDGKISIQKDYWQTPGQAIRTKMGNCSNKSFLLASLIRNELPPEQVSVALGNLHQPPKPGGHAWVRLILDDEYIMESTREDMQPLVASRVAEIYEPVVYFNDKKVSAIEGRTLLTPFAAVYADWLKDYLDWVFIEGRK